MFRLMKGHGQGECVDYLNNYQPLNDTAPLNLSIINVFYLTTIFVAQYIESNVRMV
jgi:hypothetical protein